MSSKDRIDPKANRWMAEEGVSCVKGKPPETGARAMSAQIQRLALRMRVDPDELAKRINSDTLRRTKYPVIETVDEDGFRHFQCDLGIREGRTSL